MHSDDLATKVINAIQGNPEAIKEISDALATGDAQAFRDAVLKHTGIDVSAEDAQSIIDQVKANPSTPAAYTT